jgi:hypothetical protein
MNALAAMICAPSGTLTADAVRNYGSQAASAFVNDNVPLSSGVAEIVKKAGLNKEQAQRVVEEANNRAFATLFRAGYKGNIEFPLAKLAEVSDICWPPAAPMNKTASRIQIPRQSSQTFFDAAFPPRNIEKTASVLTVNNLDNERALYAKLLVQEKALASQVDGLETAVMVKVASLNRVIEQARNERHSESAIELCIRAAGAAAPLERVLLEDNGVAPTGDLEKMAALGMLPDPGNPITGLVQELDSVVAKLDMLQPVLEQARADIGQLQSILRGSSPTTDQMFAAPSEQGPPTSEIFSNSPAQSVPVQPPAPAPVAPVPTVGG